MEIITESLLIFAKECIKLGVDGFLASTRGGDACTFKKNKNLFLNYVKPADMTIMEEINNNCNCNILHIDISWENIKVAVETANNYPG